MRFKKAYIIFVFIFSMLILNGCAPEVIELTDGENELVAEYVGGLLLRYDTHYAGKLNYQELEDDALAVGEDSETEYELQKNKPTDEQTAGQTDEPQPEVTETPAPVFVELSKIYEGYGIQVSLSQCGFYTEYENSIMPTTEDAILLIAEFKVKNTKKGKNKVNLEEKGIRYSLQSPSGGEYGASMALLDNGGLNFLRTTLQEKGTEKASLIFEVPKNFTIEEAAIVVKRGGVTAKVGLK